jgi:hypothetical protein
MTPELTEEQTNHYDQWRAMWLSHYEFGLSAQRVLLAAGVIQESEKLFLTRAERRALLSIDAVSTPP